MLFVLFGSPERSLVCLTPPLSHGERQRYVDLGSAISTVVGRGILHGTACGIFWYANAAENHIRVGDSAGDEGSKLSLRL